MGEIVGARCAGLLVAMDLPFESMVQCLMGDLDLGYDDAAVAILTAQSMKSRDAADRSRLATTA
jgi:hypothetical protein